MVEPLDEIRHLHAELTEGYQGPEDRPLGSYGVLELVYGGGVLGFGLFLAATGRQLPERVPAQDLALLGVATYKATRTISKEKVTSSLRSPFRRYVEDSHGTEVNEEARGTGMRRAVGELLGCPFCLSQWIATALACGFVVAPRGTRLGGCGLRHPRRLRPAAVRAHGHRREGGGLSGEGCESADRWRPTRFVACRSPLTPSPV